MFVRHFTYRPVVVEMAQFVCQSLHVVRFQTSTIVDDIVMGGGHCTLAYRLGHQKEVIPSSNKVACEYRTLCINYSNPKNL